MSLVTPASFLDAMRSKWSEYGNVNSLALDAVWLQIAETLNRQTEQPSLPRPVIPAELGAGKTTCAKLWCSMLPSENHPGVLIVVRTIAQADEYAKDINEWAGSQTAFAYHSDLKPKPKLKTLMDHPTLVICHAGYEKSLDKLLLDERERYDQFMKLPTGQRRLVIVDEALDQVYVARLVREHFSEILGRVRDPRILKQNPVALDVLESVQRALLDAPDTGSHVISAEALLARTSLTVEEADAAVKALWQDVRHSKMSTLDDRRRVNETLTSLRRHLAAYRWTESGRAQRALLGTRLLLPPDAGQVILDATGRLNNVYLGRPVDYSVQTMPIVRDYRNVTLYAARTCGTGKWAMRNEAGERIVKQTRDAVVGHYGNAAKTRRVLVVADLDSEEKIRHAWGRAGFAAFDVAHWNNIDGRNDWRDYDTLVALTLPWATLSQDVATHMAVKEVELDDAGLKAPPEDVRTIREIRIAAQLTQAIGRIRLRRMATKDGACQPCDLFIRFPHSFGVILDTDHVIESLRQALTGLTVVEWNIASTPRTPDGRRPKVGKQVANILLETARLMRDGDRVPLTRKQFPGAMLFNVLADAQKPESPIHAQLAALGARVEPGGYRPGVNGRAPASLVKGDAPALAAPAIRSCGHPWTEGRCLVCRAAQNRASRARAKEA